MSPVGILLPLALPVLSFRAADNWHPSGIRYAMCPVPSGYLVSSTKIVPGMPRGERLSLTTWRSIVTSALRASILTFKRSVPIRS